MKMKTLVIGIIVLIIVAAVVGGIFLLKGKSPASNTNPDQNTGNTVNIQGFAFSPSSLNVKVGDTVIWTNKDSAPHTVTSDSGSELASSSLSNRQTYSHTFNTAGTYNYHCNFHTSMKGQVIAE